MALLTRDLAHLIESTKLMCVPEAFLYDYPQDPREVRPWGCDKVFMSTEPYDDGGGPVVAAVRYQNFGWVT